MNENMNDLVECLQNNIEAASGRYYKLVLVIGSFDSGKTDLLRRFQSRNPENVAYINFNHLLTKKLIDVPSSRRPFESEKCINEIFEEYKNQILLVDNIEVLFDSALSLDPLRLLQRLSRWKIIVVAWPGSCKEMEVSYAEPGYKEHRKYSIKDLVVIDLNGWKQR